MKNFRLRHIDTIIAEEIDYSFLMKEILQYKNAFFHKVKHFTTNFKEIHDIVSEITSIELSSIKINKNNSIKIPVRIGHLSYVAMLELNDILSRDTSKEPMSEIMAKVISIACYEENKESLYDSTSLSFKRLEKRILEQPLLDMIGLYNWILETAKAENKVWEKKFFSVEVSDPDADAGGKQGLRQFNVMSTLMSTCKDFNYTEKESWYVSFDLIQEKAYKKAYEYKVQDNIRIIKEDKMKANRKNRR